MPRCMMNSVRGYRERKYWGCEADSQNVMKTRSGLVISTIPKLRPTSSTYRQTSVASSSATNLTEKSKDPYKNSPGIDYKPMSCLSFVTRFGLIKDGIPLNFTSDLVCNDEWTDSRASCVSQMNSHCSNVSSVELEEYEPTRRQDEAMDVLRHSLPEKKARMKTEQKKKELVPTKVNLVHRNKKEDSLFQPNQGHTTSSAGEVKYIYISTSKASSSNMGAPAPLLKPSGTNSVEEIKASSLKPSLAERHPVLFRYISRDKPRNMSNFTSSVLPLPDGQPTKISMPAPVMTNNKRVESGPTTSSVLPLSDGQPTKISTPAPVLTNNKRIASGPTTHLIMVKTIPANASPMKITPRSPRPKEPSEDQCLSSENNDLSTEEDDDSSSVASQSSVDETYVQRASEIDATFQQDLSRFQMESHAYTIDAGGNQIHRCMICDKVFTVFPAFRAHVNTHVRPKNRCDVCGKIFSRSWLLKGHIRTHTGERPYTCKYVGCDRRFADKSNLRSHTLIHTTKDKSYICTKCKRAFAQKRYLHKHKLEVCKI